MDGDRRRAIVYGDSLILEGVRASLERRPDLEVVVLNQPLDKPSEQLRLLRPAAVILDLGAVQPDSLLFLLQQTDLLLIGIDQETHQALVWSGRQAAAVVAADLVQLFAFLSDQCESQIPRRLEKEDT